MVPGSIPGRPIWLAIALIVALALPAAAAAASQPAETVAARKHFFGARNVDSQGNVPRDKVIMSWFSVASYAMAVDGHVVLLDTYIHKGEERPGYVPTTTAELVALHPEAVFIGHGHFDHAATAGLIATRTGAPIIGTPEHCDGIRAQDDAGPAVKCVAAVDRGSAPGAQLRTLAPLGGRLRVTALKHVHSATEPPDGENHESSITAPAAPDTGSVLLHPPGPSVVGGLNPSGDEGSSLLYQFRLGRFSLVWHDSAGPLRERAPQVFPVLRGLPPTDVEFGATLGFNDPTNGMRDPVDYVESLRPKIFYPNHHDFVAEYGASKGLEGVFRREMARRRGLSPEVRWMYDPQDYLRPHLATFDVDDPRFGDTRRCLSRRSPIGPRNIGRIRLGYSARRLLRLPVSPVTRARRAFTYCVNGGGAVSAAFSRRGRVVLAATTAPLHGNRGVRPGSRARAVRRSYPRRRALGRALYRANRRSPRLIGIRRGRVRFLAVADPRLAARPRTLRRYLRLAGF